MDKKYVFTNETKKVYTHNSDIPVTVTRIRRLSDGLLGGWIEKESNLSHQGDCFVYDNAVVINNAVISSNASIRGHVMVSDFAMVYGDATVKGPSLIRDGAKVHGSATIDGVIDVCDNVVVDGNASIKGFSNLSGNTRVCNDAIIDGYEYLHDVCVTEPFIGIHTHCIHTPFENITMTIMETEAGYKFILKGVEFDSIDKIEELIEVEYEIYDTTILKNIKKHIEKLLSVYK